MGVGMVMDQVPVRVGMRMRVGMGMVVTRSGSRVMVMPVLMGMRRILIVSMIVVMLMIMGMIVGMIILMSRVSNRFFARHSAAAIFTHYSISREASSSSRPARKSRLGAPHVGQGESKSSD